MAKAGRGSDQFPLRLPDGLRDRIKHSAEASGRSMNAEIIAALEEAFPEPMTLGEFIDRWIAPIAKAPKRELRQLLYFANDAAAAANSRFRAVLGKQMEAPTIDVIIGEGEDAEVVMTIFAASLDMDKDEA